MTVFERSMSCWVTCLLVLFIAANAAADDLGPLPENLAARAKVSATSEMNEQYAAAKAVDGHIPPKDAQLGEFGSWAVNGQEAKGKGEFTFRWKTPVQVAEVIYFGRTAWQLKEVWKDYEVYLDGA